MSIPKSLRETLGYTCPGLHKNEVPEFDRMLLTGKITTAYPSDLKLGQEILVGAGPRKAVVEKITPVRKPRGWWDKVVVKARVESTGKLLTLADADGEDRPFIYVHTDAKFQREFNKEQVRIRKRRKDQAKKFGLLSR